MNGVYSAKMCEYLLHRIREGKSGVAEIVTEYRFYLDKRVFSWRHLFYIYWSSLLFLRRDLPLGCLSSWTEKRRPTTFSRVVTATVGVCARKESKPL